MQFRINASGLLETLILCRALSLLLEPEEPQCTDRMLCLYLCRLSKAALPTMLTLCFSQTAGAWGHTTRAQGQSLGVLMEGQMEV